LRELATITLDTGALVHLSRDHEAQYRRQIQCPRQGTSASTVADNIQTQIDHNLKAVPLGYHIEWAGGVSRI